MEADNLHMSVPAPIFKLTLSLVYNDRVTQIDSCVIVHTCGTVESQSRHTYLQSFCSKKLFALKGTNLV